MQSEADPPFESRRRRLANRRPCITFQVRHRLKSGGLQLFECSVGLYDRRSSDVGEIFINTSGKVGSDVDIMVADAAVAISLALQYGCPLDVLRTAMKRNPGGSPMGVLSQVLDEATAHTQK